ncbi:MAG TPA: BolA family protein [Candidatus Kryptonia bacterium]|nr:BolA family protein [Candidatus Kryptonia bacterium]
MGITDTIERRLRERLAIERIEIVDDSRRHAGHAGAASGGGHYVVTIVSPDFAGKSTLARHRMVYDVLGALMQREIHALALTTRAPGEA